MTASTLCGAQQLATAGSDFELRESALLRRSETLKNASVAARRSARSANIGTDSRSTHVRAAPLAQSRKQAASRAALTRGYQASTVFICGAVGRKGALRGSSCLARAGMSGNVEEAITHLLRSSTDAASA